MEPRFTVKPTSAVKPTSSTRAFAPTGRYFKVLAGYYKDRIGEAYQFLDWGGVAIRVFGTGTADIVAFAGNEVEEISRYVHAEESVYIPSHWNPNKPISEP